MTSKENIYLKSPLFLKKILFDIYAYNLTKLKFNRIFKERLRELEKSQWCSNVELQQLQEEKLQRIIRHCYYNVPYYREIFENRRLKPSDVKTVKDLQKVPILTRKDVKNNFSKLIAKNFRRREMILTNTSGTTGSPLFFYWDKMIYPIIRAYFWRHWHRADFNYEDKRITMHGRMIVGLDRKKPPLWMYNKWDKQLFFSTYHLSECFFPYFIDKLVEFTPQAIEGYPSAVYVLAKYMYEKSISYKLKAVFTSSETLYPIQRDVIEKVFGCRIFDVYGLSERVVMATECEKHTGLHLNMEYGITEVVDDEGYNVPVGIEGKVISTGLENYSMPLIRYDTGDISRILDEKCECGCEFPMLAPITTKAEDQIFLPDGRYISGSLLTFPFKPMVNIRMSQIIQEDIRNIRVKIVKNEMYSDQDSQILLDGLQKCLGTEMIIHFEFEEDIPRTTNGKYRWVISKVKRSLDFEKENV